MSDLTSGTRPLAADQQVRLLISCLTVLIDRHSRETPEKKLLIKLATERHDTAGHTSSLDNCDDKQCQEVIKLLVETAEPEFEFLLSDLPAISNLKLSCTTPLAGKVKVFLTETHLVRET